MTQRKFFQLAGITVAAVWVFCITFAIAYTIRSNSNEKIPAVNPGAEITTGVVNYPSTTTTAPSLQTTTSPFPSTALSLQSLSTQAPSVSVSSPSITQPTTAASSVPKEKNDIINAYINGINALKNTQNFSMNKVDTLDVQITDVEMTGGSALKNTVMEFANGIIAPPEPESYTFIGGTDAMTGETPNSTVAPLNVAAQVNPDAVTEATSAANPDGGYEVTLVLQPETQAMNTPAPNLATMVEVIDVSSLLPSGATLTDVNISYAPSTIKAVFDSQNRIVSIFHKLTSKGGGSGKMIVSVKMTMEGTYTSTYTVTYN